MPLMTPDALRDHARRGLGWVRAHRDPVLLGVVGLTLVVAFVVLQTTGAATDNYDARAHLVVARRIFDSLTPGWKQHGILWLPLPHILSLPLVWSDQLYRSGLAVSLLSLAATVGATVHMWRLVRRLLGDDDLAVAAAIVVFALNPNVVYAASTALTEPLFIYLLLAATDSAAAWWERNTRRVPVAAGVYLALAGACRYEAWVCLAVIVPLVLVGVARRSAASGIAQPTAWTGAAVPALGLAAVGAVGPIAVVLHTWHVAGDPLAFRKLAAGDFFGRGIWQVAVWYWLKGLLYGLGVPVLLLFLAAWGDLVRAIRLRPPLVFVHMLLIPTLLSAVSFLGGHLFRFRYALTALPAAGVLCGWAAKRQPKLTIVVLALHVAWLAYPLYPWYRSSLYLESTYHARHEPGRDEAALLLREHYDGHLVLASMSSVAPFIWRTGLPLRSFVHEGNGAIRDAAMRAPRDHVGWIVLDGGGDFSREAAARPGFLDGFTLFAQSGTLTVWRAVSSGR